MHAHARVERLGVARTVHRALSLSGASNGFSSVDCGRWPTPTTAPVMCRKCIRNTDRLIDPSLPWRTYRCSIQDALAALAAARTVAVMRGAVDAAVRRAAARERQMRKEVPDGVMRVRSQHAHKHALQERPRVQMRMDDTRRQLRHRGEPLRTNTCPRKFRANSRQRKQFVPKAFNAMDT